MLCQEGLQKGQKKALMGPDRIQIIFGAAPSPEQAEPHVHISVRKTAADGLWELARLIEGGFPVKTKP